MAKKLVTIDVQDKKLKSSAKVATSKKVKEETKEIENFGVMEINNASSAKKVKNNAERGFEKTVSGETKKAVKNKISQVDDYFDFSFRKDEETKSAKTATKTTKTSASAVKTKTTTAKKVTKKAEVKAEKEEVVEKSLELKTEANTQNEQIKSAYEAVCFDSDANQIIRVARIGSLFDCDIRMMNA